MELEGKKSGPGRLTEEKTQAGGVGQRKEKRVCEEPRETQEPAEGEERGQDRRKDGQRLKAGCTRYLRAQMGPGGCW